MSQEHKLSLYTVGRSAEIGSFRFSNHKDYADYFIFKGLVQSEEELWQNDELVLKIWKHWHSQGQNGCIFAQVISSKSEKESGWQARVMRNPTASDLVHTIQMAIADPANENLSLLFPSIRTAQDLIVLLSQFSELQLANLTQIQIGNRAIFSLRILLDIGGPESWVVGFGSFDFLTKTRQSPITELAIRTKKRLPIYFGD